MIPARRVPAATSNSPDSFPAAKVDDMSFRGTRQVFDGRPYGAIWRSVLAICAGLWHATSCAGDWPQILGPQRNGTAIGEKIVDRLPSDGPPVVWNKSVGEGFAGVAVAHNRVILFHRVDEQERVEALDPLSGENLWTTNFEAVYAGGVAPDRGPRCVPLISGNRVFLLGAAGNLHCVSLDKGEPLWSRSLAADYKAQEGYFGFGSTPIVEGDKLIVNVGGRAGAGIVAFSTADGKTIWQATDEQASYSSPTAITVDGVRHVVFLTRLNTVSIDPEKGSVRWKFPFGARGPTVNAATPLVFDKQVFVSASYGVGAQLARFDADHAETVWANNETMSSQYSTCVRSDGYLYGVDGRQDVGVARLRCIDPVKGQVLWTKDRFGIASLILVNDRLVIVKDDGTLLLVAASPERYQELGQFRLFRNTTRALPALADGRLFVRDTEQLKCVDLRPAR
jgi:outer membrane protein assembly factor BamB